ncbi:MAG: AAA family ATPase [Kiritimatiellae bacterium]|nr:AAA family ATPase [Kiritimatiellia bacterium]
MFVGRKEELEQLTGLWDKRVASLVSCRGRRRVGKSTLIEEFAKRTAERFISIEGLAPRRGMSDKKQRRNFCERLAEQTGMEARDAASWPLAFAILDEALTENVRTVVLLDEISWMGGYDKDFPSYLKAAWDKRLKKHGNLVLVLCGSVSAWIADNILNSTGFVGRNSLDLEIRELPLREAIQMLGSGAARLSSAEKLDLLSVVGGIPRYLEEIRPALTVEENVRRMCFVRQGLLFREFDETFCDVFGKGAVRRREVLETLAGGALTATEIAKLLGRKVNGHLVRTLKELEYSGFVAREANVNAATGGTKRMERFRICDNYTRFYMRFIEPNKKAIASGLFRFTSMEQLAGWETVLGLQFENLVVNHVEDLFGFLGLERSLVLSAAPYVQRGTRRGEGCQIDLLIQTQRTVFVVEIKRRKEIGPDVMDEMARKVGRLKIAEGVSIRTALVYDGRLSPRIEAERGFDFVIPASRILE